MNCVQFSFTSLRYYSVDASLVLVYVEPYQYLSLPAAEEQPGRDTASPESIETTLVAVSEPRRELLP